MKSINKINGAILNSASINFYNSLSADYDNYRYNWRNRYFTYTLPGWNEPVSLTPAGNFIFREAMRELDRIAGAKGKTKTAKLELEYMNEPILHISINTEVNMSGVTISYNTKFAPMKENNFKHFKIRSNETLEALDIEKYFKEKILSKYLFAPGLFRNIQLIRNLSKTEAIQWYKTWIKAAQKPDQWEAEAQASKTLKQRLKKKLNIRLEDSFKDAYLIHLLKINNRHKRTVQLFREPSIFDMAERYSSHYDTEDNMEEFLEEEFSEFPKKAIFA